MTLTLHAVLLVLAVICFIVAAVAVPVPRVSMVALGLVFFAAAFLFP